MTSKLPVPLPHLLFTLIFIKTPTLYTTTFQNLKQIVFKLFRTLLPGLWSIPKFCHVTPILKSLHWLKINERIEYKLLSLTYKALTTAQPTYLDSLISVQPSRATLSSIICCHSLSTTYIFSKNHQRSFRYASPHLWRLESTSSLILLALHKPPC